MSGVVPDPKLGEENQVHQDQRIGLALAVLLLGAAGAFFFRNDPKPAGSSPRLKSARVLDARIAEKSIAPYLQDLPDYDDDHEPRTKTGKAPDRTKRDSDVGSHRSLPQLDAPDFLGPDDRLANGTGTGVGSSNDGVQDLAPIPFPVNNGDSRGSAETNERLPKTPTTTDRMHVVQKGETLSSIAAKELGSSNRFQDVFDANRDQLKDANDVRVGMSLRIPARRVARMENSSPGPSPKPKDRPGNSAPPLLPTDASRGEAGTLPPIGVDPDKPVPGRAGESTPAKKKFEPAKRPPFGVKGLGTESGESQPPSKPIRKLTQLPPHDAGGKVAR